MRSLSVLAAAFVLTFLNTGCRRSSPGEFTDGEKVLIHEASEGREQPSAVPSGTMRVLTIEDSLDLTVLRGISRDLSADALLSEEFAMLSRLMVATVTHPTQDGVGIAAPQVGLNRRVVAVQRFDKEGEPFEVYPNIHIVCLSDSMAYGPEGCLSVPDMRADVLRSQEVVIEYTDMDRLKETASELRPRKLRKRLEREYGAGRSYGRKAGGEAGWRAGGAPLPTVRDTISGFTAVIFQHETDHLDGILYIDRL